MSFINIPDFLIIIFGSCFILFYLIYLIRIFILTRKTFNRFNTVFYKLFIRTTYFSLILISLMGPSFGISRKEIPVTQKEIFLLMDVSRSMTVDDVQPSRFEKARSAAYKLIERSRNTKFGIIIFTSEAYLHSPITEDKEALKTFLGLLTPDLIEHQGTLLNPAIKMALKKFDQQKEPVKPVSRFVVIYSDGEDFSDNGNEISKQASEAGISVFAVGVGTESGAPILSEGKTVTTALERHYLQQITNAGRGNYYEINDHADNSNKLIKDLNDWQGKSVLVKKADAAANKYFYFLLPALILMIADILITLNIIKL